MDIGRALTYFSEDERWVEKTAIGTGLLLISSLLLVALIGVLGYFILFGYLVRLIQNVRDDVHPVLPEWDRWGDDLVRGVKLACVYLVWALPMVLISVPMIIVGIAFEESNFGGEGVAWTLMACASCLYFLVGIAYAILQPGFTIAFLRNEEINDGLQVSEIWEWTRDNIGNVVIVAFLTLIASISLTTISTIVGLILCIIGAVVTLPLSQLFVFYLQGHLYGQLARVGAQEAGRGAFDAMHHVDTQSESDLDPEFGGAVASTAGFSRPDVFEPKPDIAVEPDHSLEPDLPDESEQPGASAQADEGGQAGEDGQKEEDDPREAPGGH